MLLVQFVEDRSRRRVAPTQHLEEIFLFLRMVEAVGKSLHVVNDRLEHRGIRRELAFAHLAQHGGETLDDQGDVAMFAADKVDCLRHDCSPRSKRSRQAAQPGDL